MFGRKKRKGGDDDEAQSVDVAAEPETPEPEPEPTRGPWDVDDLPDDDAVPRVDLGGLRVPIPDGVEVRVDVNPEGEVVAAVALDRGSSLQLNAFAAPRRAGIWDEIRAEIRDALVTQGGAGDDVAGPFGTELRARVPSGTPGQTTPARFLGVDGPRWFLRGLLTGPAATDLAQSSRLEEVFKGAVVVRGKDAMAPRDGLPLRLPKEAVEAAGEQAEDATEPGRSYADDDLNPFERGPEITEIQ